MNIQHKELAAGRWHKLTLAEQLANVGSEVERALELLDLTVSINKNFARLKELLRLREALADYFAFDNVYRSTDGSWRKYFFAFNYAARGHS